MSSSALPSPSTSRIPNLEWHGVKFLPLLLAVAIGAIIWFMPPPEGVAIEAWHLLAIFVGTIVGIILKPMPMGAVALTGITVTALTGTLSIGDSLSGFGNSTIWLIVIAFFISRGFIKTGLGARIAYMFMAAVGKRTLGLSYGLIATDLVLAPAIPSNTARAGGVIYPIALSLTEVYRERDSQGRVQRLYAAVEHLLVEAGQRHSGLPSDRVREIFASDIELNAQGLGIWLMRRAKRRA